MLVDWTGVGNIRKSSGILEMFSKSSENNRESSVIDLQTSSAAIRNHYCLS